MGYRVEYEVRKLPDSFVTSEMRYTFVDDDKAQPDRYGRKRQKMVSEKVESRGGWIFLIRGKPGHSFRLTSLDQIEAMKLSPYPRLIDNDTGEECDESGIPLNVQAQMNASKSMGNVSGRHGTEIDVMDNSATGDEALDASFDGVHDESGPVPQSVETAINNLEE